MEFEYKDGVFESSQRVYDSTGKAPTLTATNDKQLIQHKEKPKSVIRRLTPVECERLQGFSDNYTQIPWRGKENKDCPNGPRYKALGNSMAVPVIRWLGERIKGIDARSKVRYVGNVNAARQKFVTTREN